MIYGLLLCVLLLSGDRPPSYNCRSISEDYDLIAVLLRDGRLPQVPWDGLDGNHRELLWSYACRGMLIQRMSWSGYLIVCPAGTADSLLHLAEAIADPPLAPDSGLWSDLLQFRGNDRDPVILLFSNSTTEPGLPLALPLRSSGWLSEGPDTLIHEGPWSNDVFLWGRSPEDLDLGSTDWRGLSSQVALADGALLPVNVTTCVNGTPASLQDIDQGFHPYDSVFSSPWGESLIAMDSLMTELYPVRSSRDHLLWLRGIGSSHVLVPWKAWPMPSPLAGAPVSVQGPYDYGPPAPRVSPPPGTSRISVTLTDSLAGPDELAVAAALMERMLAWLLLPDADWLEEVSVMPSGSEGIEIAFLGCTEGIGSDSALAMGRKALAPMVLSKPSSAMLNNAVIRASFLTGRRISDPDPLRMVRTLARLAGLSFSG